MVHVTRLPIPLQETGAFNLFAWQGVWIAGVMAWCEVGGGWIAIGSWCLVMWLRCVVRCVCSFLACGMDGLGAHLTQQSLGMSLDKWSIGPMRLVNLIAFTIVCYWMRRYLVKLVSIEPFLTLGKASLQVFCAHVFFVFVGLALLYEDVPHAAWEAGYGILLVTFAGLIWVAVREVRARRAERVAAGAAAKSSSVVS